VLQKWFVEISNPVRHFIVGMHDVDKSKIEPNCISKVTAEVLMVTLMT
jgi:hypothetical protein